MSQHNGERYCDYIRCHLVIAPGDRSQLNYGKFDYHGACFLAERREQTDAVKPEVKKTA